MVRQNISQRLKAVRRILRLFEDDGAINGYRHTCCITNLTLPTARVWRLYRHRATWENRIKELKYDYALDKINQPVWMQQILLKLLNIKKPSVLKGF